MSQRRKTPIIEFIHTCLEEGVEAGSGTPTTSEGIYACKLGQQKQSRVSESVIKPGQSNPRQTLVSSGCFEKDRNENLIIIVIGYVDDSIVAGKADRQRRRT